MAASLFDAAAKLGTDDACSQAIAKLLHKHTELLGNILLERFEEEQPVYRFD